MIPNDSAHRFCVAPMMDWSDRHCRHLWRLLSRHARLYTEMVTTGALIHGDRQRFLRFSPQEQPVALQLGGSEPGELARCARWAQEWGYDEVNLNCGCPSDRVQSGAFGACLMARPERVADCVKAMHDACALPITVKHRIGIDDMESYQQLLDFIGPVAAAGCDTFIVHARKAWLSGLSPKQNREIPPLNYPWVYQIKRDLPALTVVTNGGITDLKACHEHLQSVDGVMLGRAAYHDPWVLADVDHAVFGGTNPLANRHELIAQMLPYIEQELLAGTPLNHMTRHLLGLYQGVPGARQFRRHLSENAHLKGAGITVLEDAWRLVRDPGLHRRQVVSEASG